MIITLSGKDREACRTIFDDLFRLRYDVFIEAKHWSLPAKGRLEIDKYDNDSAQYFYGMDGDGNLVSHVRVSPSLTDSLIADCFPHLIEEPHVARSATVFEGTRYIVQPVTRNRQAMCEAKAELLVAMFEWCRGRGGTDVQVIVETKLLPSFLEMTPEVRPLGLSQPYGGGTGTPGGGEAIAIRCPITSKSISDLMSFGGLKNGVGLMSPADTAKFAA